MALQDFIWMRYVINATEQNLEEGFLNLVEAGVCRLFPCRLEGIDKGDINIERNLSGELSRDRSEE
jgi:hypothetical protein